MEAFEEIFREVVEVLIIPIELIGVLIILHAAVVNFIAYIRRKKGVRLALAQSLATALEFKLASEILRTVVVQEWEEILLVGAIILLRAALTLLIHWEIKNETAHEPKDDKTA